MTGAQCTNGQWQISTTSITAATPTIMCPVSVNGDLTLNAVLNTDGCGLVKVSGVATFGAAAAVSTDLGGNTFPPITGTGDKFTFMTFGSSNGVINTLSVPRMNGLTNQSVQFLQKDDTSYYVLFYPPGTTPVPASITGQTSSQTTSPPGSTSPSSTDQSTAQSTSQVTSTTTGQGSSPSTTDSPTQPPQGTGQATAEATAQGTAQATAQGTAQVTSPSSTSGMPSSTTANDSVTAPSSGLPWWAILAIVLGAVLLIVIIIVIICCCCCKKGPETV